MRTVKIAAAQMLVEGGAVAANLARAEQMIQAAADQQCEIVVLPECCDVGWTWPAAHQLAEPIPGPHFDRLSRIAASRHIIVAAGLTERHDAAVYNSAVIIDRDGRLVALHRKINVLDIAQHLYAIGDRLEVGLTDFGRLGINICADNFPNCLDIGTTIGRLGACLLLSPSAWAVDANHDNDKQPYGAIWRQAYAQLAQSFQMPIVGASNVGPILAGPWAGRRCIGCSLIVAGDGNVAAAGPYDQPALVVADVELVDQRPRGTKISGML